MNENWILTFEQNNQVMTLHILDQAMCPVNPVTNSNQLEKAYDLIIFQKKLLVI